VGESGSGKSSLAYAVIKLLPKNMAHYSGRVFFKGFNIVELNENELRKKVRLNGIAMVFQGAMNTLKPKVFRWHIPFHEKIISRDWADFLSRYFNAYETVIVSCRAYLDPLKRLEYDGAAYHIYPYIDFSEYIMLEKNKVSELCDRFSIDEDDVVVAVVACLDSVKGHDIAVKALSRAVKKIPNLKLVFVGNGSFSSSKQGLGLPKADLFRQHL